MDLSGYFVMDQQSSDLTRIKAHLRFWEALESEPIFSVKIRALVSWRRTMVFPWRSGWPNAAAHFCSPGKSGYSTAAATARSVSKRSDNVWLYAPAPLCTGRTWRRGFHSSGSWCISRYHYQGKGAAKVRAPQVKYSKGILWVKCCKSHTYK